MCKLMERVDEGAHKIPHMVQYCAKVTQTIIAEYRDLSAVFNEILP